MSKHIETYLGHSISECLWGFCVDGKKHFIKFSRAKQYIKECL